MREVTFTGSLMAMSIGSKRRGQMKQIQSDLGIEIVDCMPKKTEAIAEGGCLTERRPLNLEVVVQRQPSKENSTAVSGRDGLTAYGVGKATGALPGQVNGIQAGLKKDEECNEAEAITMMAI